jgi:hypothetical protein
MLSDNWIFVLVIASIVLCAICCCFCHDWCVRNQRDNTVVPDASDKQREAVIEEIVVQVD